MGGQVSVTSADSGGARFVVSYPLADVAGSKPRRSSRCPFVIVSSPLIAGGAVLLVALMVIGLLRSAANQGTDALEKAKAAQVKTTADSFNARVQSSFSSLGALGSRPWQLTLGNAADQAVLKSYSIDPNALSGSFLVDAHDTITDGVLLRKGRLGSTFAPARVGEGQGRARLGAGGRAARGPLRRHDRAAELRLRRRHPRQDARPACVVPMSSSRR